MRYSWGRYWVCFPPPSALHEPRVFLVEASQELPDWYGHDPCDRLSKVTDVVCGDIYDQIGRFGPDAKSLLDIWKDFGECLFDEPFVRCKWRFRHVWGWGEEVTEVRRLPSRQRGRPALSLSSAPLRGGFSCWFRSGPRLTPRAPRRPATPPATAAGGFETPPFDHDSQKPPPATTAVGRR